MYYVITCTPDGVSVTERTQEELQQAFTPDEWGNVELDGLETLGDLPDSDPNYWGGGFLIIKGEIVTPVEKEVVIHYEIE